MMKGCRPLTEAEVALVAQSFGGRYAARDKALFILGVKSGFRISELLSLRVGDVWEHGRLVDRVTVSRRYMKGGKPKVGTSKTMKVSSRSLPLHEEAKAALRAWLQTRQKTSNLLPKQMLFPSRKGDNQAITRRQALTILTDAYEANGLTGKLATHTLRKTFTSNVYRQTGRDIVKLKNILGHAHIATMEAYLSFDQA